jgi:cell division protein FtsQ
MWDSPRMLNLLALLIAAAAVLACVAGAASWMARRPLFAIKAIRVEPAPAPGSDQVEPFRHVNAATIHAEAVPRILATTRNSFFTVNLETVRHAIEGVSWVRRAQVRREWPDRLVVTIEEHRVLGMWDDGRLVNTYGELFAANPAEAEEDNGALPELSGPAGSERDVASRYLDFKRWLAKLSLVPDQVTLTARYAWSLHVANATTDGLTIDLGRERDANTVPERIGRMIGAWPQLIANWPRLTSVDLRYPNGLALRAEGMRFADDAPTARSASKPAKPRTVVPKKPSRPARNNRT